MKKPPQPHHLNASPEDLNGNQGIGRYLFLTGSDTRANELSQLFTHTEIKKHPRQHNLYLGRLATGKGACIDVGAISTGMGGPSIDIIVNELIALGAKRLLRVGTAASLQANQIKVGDVVIATGAVRDDKASWDYIYPEYPAIASLPYLIAAGRASEGEPGMHFGLVHSKSSLFAREMGYSLTQEGKGYMSTMQSAGVLATEMECAQLFTLAALFNAKLDKHTLKEKTIQAGAILAIIGDSKTAFHNNENKTKHAIQRAISIAIKTTVEAYFIDTHQKPLF